MWPFQSKQTPPRAELKSVTLPEVTPRWYLSNARQDDLWLTDIAIREGYNVSPIVYACVEKRAKLIASVPWVAEIKRGDTWEAAPNSPLQILIDRPNPDQSFYEIMYEASQALDLSGNAYFSEIRRSPGSPPMALWLLPAKNVRIKPGSTNLIDSYEYNEGGERRVIAGLDMLHLRMPNPNSRWFGMPVLMAAARATDIDREAGIWQQSSLQNRGVLDLVFEVPDGTTNEQVTEMKERWIKKHAGSQNAREPIFTSGKVSQIGQTAVEMDFVMSRRANWTEIAAVFGVPLAALGFTESVNLANAAAMEKQMWQDTIIPQLELIQRQIQHQLATEFGAEWRVRYDVSNIAALQVSNDAKITNAVRLWGMGVPLNTIMETLELNIDEVEGGDVGYIPAGMVPAAFDMTGDTDTPAKAGEAAYGNPKAKA